MTFKIFVNPNFQIVLSFFNGNEKSVFLKFIGIFIYSGPCCGKGFNEISHLNVLAGCKCASPQNCSGEYHFLKLHCQSHDMLFE